MGLVDKLKDQFGISEITPEVLDRFTNRDFSLENNLIEAVLEFPDELKSQGVLLWADNRTCYSDQHDRLVNSLRAHFGDDYEHYIAARYILYAADISRPLDSLQELFSFLKRHKLPVRSADEFLMDFVVSGDFSEVIWKLETHRKLSNNRLDEFYGDGKVNLFSLGEYTVTASKGFYEHKGGFCLSLNDQTGELVHVSGYLHRNTNIISIHGAKPTEEGSTEVTERMDTFRETVDIHPANLTLLMYIKLGEMLNHTDVKIMGSASSQHNRQGNNSKLYMIPRNYFRLRVNPQSGYYEFDAAKRDQLLRKISGKSEIVNTAFQKIDDYMVNRTPPSV